MARPGARQGKFDHLADREYLWATLLRIVRGKVVDAIRRETKEANVGGQALGESALVSAGGEDNPAGLGGVAGDDPTPLMLAVVREQHQRLSDALRDDTVRAAARLRMEGYRRAEIAKRLNIRSSAVDRKLKLVRGTWDHLRKQDDKA